VIIFFAAGGCARPTPELTGFDLTRWKNDKQGCNGYRAATRNKLTAELDLLRGVKEMQVIELLGKPDENELYKRNQKYFYYWLSGSPACNAAAETQRLSLRFNAMGYAKEVLLESVPPPPPR